MLDWFNPVFGGKALKNPAGIQEKPLEMLAQDFSVLDEILPGIPERVVRYIVDGDDDEVVGKLTLLPGGGEKMHIRCVGARLPQNGITPRTEFFRTFNTSEPDVWRRLGHVYHALAQQARTRPSNALQQAQQRLSGAFIDPKLDWLEILLIEATQMTTNMWPARCRQCPALNAALVEKLLRLDGFSPEVLMRAVFAQEADIFCGTSLEPVFLGFPDLKESAVRNAASLSAVLKQSDFRKRARALSLMKKIGIPPELFLETVVPMALGSSKQVREASQSFLESAKSAALPFILQKLESGSTQEKICAIQLYAAWNGPTARGFLTKRHAEESNKKVWAAIDKALAVNSASATVSDSPEFELPPLERFDKTAPLGPEIERAWRATFEKVNAAIAGLLANSKRTHYAPNLGVPSDEAISEGFRLLQMDGRVKPILKEIFYIPWEGQVVAPLKDFWQRPELNALHLIRFLLLVESLKYEDHNEAVFSYGYWMEALFPAFARAHPNVGLRDLGAAFFAAGLDAGRIGRAALRRDLGRLALTPAQTWPYWAENLDILADAFEPATGSFMERYYEKTARRNAFAVLADLPKVPSRFVPMLWEVALGPKSERPLAQRCLHSVPDKLGRLKSFLPARDLQTRSAAAEWLGEIGDRSGIEPLLAALKKEKQENAKAAMIVALERLGAPIEDLLSRAKLLKEAEAGVAKAVPGDLQWLPMDRLPRAHWQDNGKPLAGVIVQWWLVQGFKSRNPEPGPLLRRYCAALVRAEREALGQFILESWIAEDVTPISRADAEAGARQHAQQMHRWTQTVYWPQGSPKKTEEEFFNDALPGFLKQPKGSAIASKGILAVAGACCGADAAATVSRYLKEWYGMRSAQCRALLQMLAWVEHKSATQLLLAVGSRFRTKVIQEEANRLAQLIAERHGWSIAELADRTIPSAGLDETGALTLDYGPRKFFGRLNDHLDLALSDATGATIKSLPEPRKDDNEAKAAEAKKNLAASKKELKTVFGMQRDRLYEAMCTERTWPFDDWNTYLNRHPIMRHHCQRLVWTSFRDGKTATLFRALADGSLTDADDHAVTVAPEDRVRIAHERHLSGDFSAKWRQHFTDYEVEPLFEQFGRSPYVLPEALKEQEEIVDFRGHMLEAFRLRARATKLGYNRGQTQDGGWFFDYEKRFPTLGIKAVLTFTGNGLPETNRAVALQVLHFERLGPEGETFSGASKIALGEIPPVLLSECWSDIRGIAAEGSGFDADWEKKSEA